MTMDEYIKREDALKAVSYAGPRKMLSLVDVALMVTYNKINSIPAADVAPVVRCKDCEHGQFMPACSMYLCRCTGVKLRYADDYCNYGERKEQE
jgi:hypothetical protein